MTTDDRSMRRPTDEERMTDDEGRSIYQALPLAHTRTLPYGGEMTVTPGTNN